jgi:tripartite-type tricarboxylate transporter receptor subunit TctC
MLNRLVLSRRSFTASAISAAFAGALSPMTAFAQAMPDMVKIIVGFPPGGPTDTFARLISQKVTGTLGTNVIVDNKPGAGGQIGVMTIKDAPADGTTYLFTPASMLILFPHTFAKLGYKVEDVAPVSTGIYMAHGFGVGPAVPETVKNLADFIAWAKANPEKASVGNPSAGSMPHMIPATLAKLSGAPLNNIPFQGSGPGLTQLLGGQIAAMSSPIGDHLQHIASGKIRLLATSGENRSPFAPNVPTYKEQGFPDIVFREWFGFFLPGKASAAQREKAAAIFKTALALPEVIESVKKFGMEVVSSTPAQLAEQIKKDTAIAGKMVQITGFKADA